jgi:hypothetical protein
MNNVVKNKQAAIVCSHVAAEHQPILRAVRTEPLEPEDSGWQFLCNSGKEEREDEARVWLIYEVSEREPSLSDFMELPAGTKIQRIDRHSPWKTVP